MACQTAFSAHMSERPTSSEIPPGALRTLFDAAIALPLAARSAWLDAHVSALPLREQLQRMLDAADGIGALDRPAIELAERIGDVAAMAASEWVGRRIGPFRLLRQIGQGGMSFVFLGERADAGFNQRVAVKLLRMGLSGELERHLFEREQRALASLSHPNIARFIDGGVTEGGVPYLVMEYVDGRPITEDAATRRLGLRERVATMIEVCAAVAAAHRALIVHRDLKPSNILIDAEGHVRLLDFGIAKLLDDGAGPSTQTVFGALTPAYAAPEQFAGRSISTATDVYALGVTLHELLLGQRPREGATLRASSRVDAAVLVPAGLPVDAGALRAALTGDLDNILAKALDADPAQRYPDAAALADDLQCYLDGRPVCAYPPSRRYRARKFVSRHKGAVASSLAFLLALVVALGTALWQAQVAREQARIARNQSDRADATRDFVVELLQTASADLPKDQRPTPEALVAEAATKAREEPDLDPLVRVQILLTLSRVARSTSDFDAAEDLIDDAIERLRVLGLPPTSDEWIAAMVAKGNLLHSTNRSAEADRLIQTLLPALNDNDSDYAVSALMLYGATRAFAGDADRAVAIAQQALTKAQRVFGADSVNGIETATYLGQLCASLRRYRESSAILEEATARWRRLQLPRNEQFARSLFQLAVAKERIGDRAAVEPLYHEGIELMRRVHEGPYHRLAPALIGYARFLIDEDRFDEAAVAVQEAIAINLAVFGPDHVETAAAIGLRGLLQAARQDHAAAEVDTRTAYQVLLQHAKPAGYEDRLVGMRLQLADLLLTLGRAEEAAALLAEPDPDLLRVFGANSPESAQRQQLVARLDLLQGNTIAALATIDRALAEMQTADLPAPMVELRTRALRAEALLRLARGDEALAEIDRALALQKATRPSARSRAIGLLALRVRVEHAQGDSAAVAATRAQAHALRVAPQHIAAGDRASLQIGDP
jgi:serine/threonine protein kinase